TGRRRAGGKCEFRGGAGSLKKKGKKLVWGGVSSAGGGRACIVLSVACVRVSFRQSGVYEIQVCMELRCVLFFFQAEDGIRDSSVTGVQTCALPISHTLTHTHTHTHTHTQTHTH